VSLIGTLLAAIDRVREPRLFHTERGYQGQLKSELDRLLDLNAADLTRPIVEEEYQKQARRHGLRLRPDIIVHVPFDRGLTSTRRHNNYLVVQAKLSAKQAKANEDFMKLETICSTLNYPLGAFVNIASTHLWLPRYARRVTGPFVLYEIAVKLENGEIATRTSTS
jgi:hypothetical protein